MSSIKKEYDETTNIVNTVIFERDEIDDRISYEIIKSADNYEIIFTFGDKEVLLSVDDMKMINTITNIALNSVQQYIELNKERPTCTKVDW